MGDNTGEKVLDENQWRVEALGVVDDVKSHVKDIELSSILKSTKERVYLNLTTLENSKYCVELSSLGFLIVDNKHDACSNRIEKYFETPYSLLEHISPKYTQSFGNMLLGKLKELQEWYLFDTNVASGCNKTSLYYLDITIHVSTIYIITFITNHLTIMWLEYNKES